MRLYREIITGSATGTEITLVSKPVEKGYLRLYQGRLIMNRTAGRGTFKSYLTDPSQKFIIGYGTIDASTWMNEEAGHRWYSEDEYWSFYVTNILAGDLIQITLMGIEVTRYEFMLGIVP